MDFDVLTDLVPIRGRTVLDVGCGDGALVKRLRAAGAGALGLDVDVGRARAADPDGRYVEAGAEAIPLDDASVDVAILMRSLHHVPDPDAALRELRRVVRDAVYVAEPLPRGEYFELMRLVDDETEVLANAQAALARAAGFERVHSVEYEVTMRIDDFEGLRERVLAADPDRAGRFAAVEDELRAGFRPGEYAPPMRADLLRAVSSGA
jgi:ubiquinone/menaquinone biosynthesis C-methylase UbiE